MSEPTTLRPAELGDETALYHQHHDRLRRLVRAAVHQTDDHTIDDAVSFAFVQLLRYQPDRDTVGGWLYRVAHREAIRLAVQRREHASVDVLLEGRDPDLTRTLSHDPIPSHERTSEALGVLAGLPVRQRQVLSRSVAGLSRSEIAVETGWSPRTVDRQLVRARADVRRCGRG